MIEIPIAAAALDCASETETAIRALGDGVLAQLRPLGAEVSFDYLGVPAPLRGQGVADQALTLACMFADASKMPMVMQPDSGFGSDLGRLVRFYGRHGFAPVAGAAPFTMRRLPASAAHALDATY